MAVDVVGTHAWEADRHEQIRETVLSASVSALHARVLRGEWKASVREPGAVVWAAGFVLVSAGDYGV